MLRVLHANIPDSGRIHLSAEESHHLVRVRRAAPGEELQLMDGAGTVARGVLREARAKAAEVEVFTCHRLARPAIPLTLFQAIPKGKGMEHIVQKATELGVSRIVPLNTERGDVQLKGHRSSTKSLKWEAAAIEAIKQCGNPWKPEITEPLDLHAALALHAPDTRGLVASLRPPVRRVSEILETTGGHLKAVSVAVGPEGDFSPDEYQLLEDQGWHSATLGPLVLRVETASIALLTLVLDQIRARCPDR